MMVLFMGNFGKIDWIMRWYVGYYIKSMYNFGMQYGKEYW